MGVEVVVGGSRPGGAPTGAGAGATTPGAAGATTPGAAGTTAGAAPRATRTPRAFIQALNSSAVMRLPFWLMSKRQGVLSNSVFGLYAAGSFGSIALGAGTTMAMAWQLSIRKRSNTWSTDCASS
jgi:hypothetical protein